MPKYSYVAKDANGKTIRSVANVDNETALYEALRNDNKFLISCKAEDETKKKYKMKPMQLSEFCRELGTLLSAGVSLVRALNIMSQEETISKSEKEIYLDMLRRIRQGNAFSETMEAQGRAFPELLINMFRAAEQSGSMDRTALRMADHYQKEYRLQSKIKGATMYPKILMFVVVAVVIIIFCYIMPEFTTIFQDMELPGITKFMLALSDFLTSHWQLVILGLIGLVAAIKAILTVPAVKLKADEIKLKLPKIGILMRTVYTARFARTLCSLYTSGIPIVTAMQIGKNTVGNKYLESQFDDAIVKLRRGEALSKALDEIDGFHKKLSSAVAIGEETGSLDTMLISTADNFDYEAEQAISKMIGYLEPAMIIIMAIVVGTIMVSVMVPLVNVYSQIEASGQA